MNDRKYFLYYKVLLSDMPPASSLQACKPASLVVPPCQDIAYHVPNQEDNTLLLTPQLNYPSLFQKVTFYYTLRIRSRKHVDYILHHHPPPPFTSYTSSYIVTSAERGKCKSIIDSLNCSLKVLMMNLCILLLT